MSRKLLGEVAIELGLATHEQVLAALKEQYRLRCVEKRHLFLGEVLAHLGVITVDQLVTLLDHTGGHEWPEEQRQKVFLGDVAVAKGYVTPTQLYASLRQQREEDQAGLEHRLIGEIMVDHGYLSAYELEDVISTLVDQGYADYRGAGVAPIGDETPRRPTVVRRDP